MATQNVNFLINLGEKYIIYFISLRSLTNVFISQYSQNNVNVTMNLNGLVSIARSRFLLVGSKGKLRVMGKMWFFFLHFFQSFSFGFYRNCPTKRNDSTLSMIGSTICRGCIPGSIRMGCRRLVRNTSFPKHPLPVFSLF